MTTFAVIVAGVVIAGYIGHRMGFKEGQRIGEIEALKFEVDAKELKVDLLARMNLTAEEKLRILIQRYLYVSYEAVQSPVHMLVALSSDEHRSHYEHIIRDQALDAKEIMSFDEAHTRFKIGGASTTIMMRVITNLHDAKRLAGIPFYYIACDPGVPKKVQDYLRSNPIYPEPDVMAIPPQFELLEDDSIDW